MLIGSYVSITPIYRYAVFEKIAKLNVVSLTEHHAAADVVGHVFNAVYVEAGRCAAINTNPLGDAFGYRGARFHKFTEHRKTTEFEQEIETVLAEVG